MIVRNMKVTVRRALGSAAGLARRAAAVLRGLPAGHPALVRYGALLALVVLLGAATRTTRERLASAVPQAPRTQAAAAALAPEPEAPAPSPTPEPMRWSRPAPGEVVGAFSPDALVWSDTLGQWQTHPGVDIAGAPGEAVFACGDGTVVDAYADRLWGNVIVVDHGEGYTSTYASLNTLSLVGPGDAVKRGDVISAFGRSADCEAAMGWHLHFCLEKDGAPVDFGALLNEGD